MSDVYYFQKKIWQDYMKFMSPEPASTCHIDNIGVPSGITVSPAVMKDIGPVGSINQSTETMEAPGPGPDWNDNWWGAGSEPDWDTADDTDEKPSNPKDIIGTDKVPLGLVPGSALAYQALGHLEGNLKYGLVNWREAGVRTSVYIDALLRHTLKFVNGEWADPTTQVPHLGSMGACINIIIDAYECGKLVDDRPKSAPVAETIDRLSGTVKHLRALYKDKHPKHYTIAENEEPDSFASSRQILKERSAQYAAWLKADPTDESP